MKPSILLRVASILTLIFCAGHTYGALASSSRDPEQAAVFMAMQAFPFEIMGARRTHWDFYRGFSLLFSATLLLLAVLLRSEEHTSELQSLAYLVCRLLLEKKKYKSSETILIKFLQTTERATAQKINV